MTEATSRSQTTRELKARLYENAIHHAPTNLHISGIERREVLSLGERQQLDTRHGITQVREVSHTKN
jgi:hypothetical protein